MNRCRSLPQSDDPVTCAIYARDNNLLDVEGWKRFKRLANKQKKLYRMANQAKLRSYNSAPRFKYGVEVPRDFKHAMWLDKRNGNTQWTDATKLEMSQLDDYSTFKDVRQFQKGIRRFVSISCSTLSTMDAARPALSRMDI